MKKWIIAGLGMGALSACSVAFVFGFSGGPKVKTEYMLGSNYVGCDSAVFDDGSGRAERKSTQVRVDFVANAEVDSVTVSLVGKSDNQNHGFTNTYSGSGLSSSDNRNYHVLFEADSRTNPLPTGIIVVPAKEKIKKVVVDGASPIGSFSAKLTAKSGSFSATTSSGQIPVYSKCRVIETTSVDVDS